MTTKQQRDSALRKPVAAGLAVALAAVGVWLWHDVPADGVRLAAPASAASSAQPAALTPLAGAASEAAMPAEAAASQALVGLAGAQQMPPLAALRALKRCYFANSCGEVGDRPLDAHFAVSQAISERIAGLPTGGGNAAELAALAREFIAFPDGHVQAAALALAAKLPPDATTVNATVAALKDSYDQLLFRQALPVLQQWQEQGLNSGYDDMLATTLHTGGIHAAQVVAENLLPFLNDANLGRYEAVLEKLQPGARQDALRQSLREYRLRKTGA